MIKRRRLGALLFVAAGLALGVMLWPRGDAAETQRPGVVLEVPGREAVHLTSKEARLIGSGRRPLSIPERRTVTRGSAEITYELDLVEARRQLGQAAGGGGSVRVSERPIAARVEAPIVQQVYPNNCETAALEMLLATRGFERDQVELQKALRRDGPLDPRTDGDGEKVWGNPRYGFVGRAEGGGLAGGFGVYPKPLMQLAERWVSPVNLSAKPPAAIYRRLLQGRAVLVWIGLSAGPYESWTGPRGEPVTVNFGEHTVLLRGLRGNSLLVNDPLSGERLVWSKEEFESKWSLLGRRAISA